MAPFNPTTWTLADIIADVRQVTGRPDASMMTDQVIVDYINRYYQYVLPKELKIFFGYTYYTFFTRSGVDTYVPPATFQTLNPAITFDGFGGDWYISPDLFWQDYPQFMNKVVVGTGNGSIAAFSFNIPAFPVLPGSVYVTDGTQIAQDDGSGSFTGNGTGSIDYLTGAVSVTFTLIPGVNANIEVTSQTYVSNRPQALLYYDNKFVLRWVPDDVYLVRMEGIKVTPALLLLTDLPFRTDLGPLISYGASLKIFSNFNQMDQYDQIYPEYVRFKDVCMQDTYEEYLYQRSVPTF